MKMNRKIWVLTPHLAGQIRAGSPGSGRPKPTDPPPDEDGLYSSVLPQKKGR